MRNRYDLRSATVKDQRFLLDMLVEAVNWNPQRQLSREAIVADPDLAHYIDGWPLPGELGVIAEADGQPIGAAWLRYFPSDDRGYGYIADDLPELSMAVSPLWRRRGVGRALLREIAQRALSAKIRAISLSVERANYAHQFYTSEGYRVVGRGPASDTMVKDLSLTRKRRTPNTEQK